MFSLSYKKVGEAIVVYLVFVKMALNVLLTHRVSIYLRFALDIFFKYMSNYFLTSDKKNILKSTNFGSTSKYTYMFNCTQLFKFFHITIGPLGADR